MHRMGRMAAVGAASLMIGSAPAVAPADAAPGGGHGGGMGGAHIAGGMGGAHMGGSGMGAGARIGGAAPGISGGHFGSSTFAGTAASGQHAFAGRNVGGGLTTGRSVGFAHGGESRRHRGRFVGDGFGYGFGGYGYDCDPVRYQQGFCDNSYGY